MKFDYKFFSVFLIISTSIFLKAFFHEDGYLSPDSMNYLRLAQTIADGNGFYVTDLLQPEKSKLFAVWPVGYSFFIFLISKLFFVDVFWASKLLNVMILGLIFLLLKKVFKENAFFYGSIFLISPFLELFSYTWSESAFVLGFIWFTLAIYRYTQAQNWIWFVNILCAALLMFFTRYIGAFGVGIIGLLALYFLVLKNYRQTVKLIAGASLVSVIIITYLYNNFRQTGLATGMPRIPSPETNHELLNMLFKAQLVEFHPFVIYPFHISSPWQLYVFPILFVFLLGSIFIQYMRLKEGFHWLWLFFFINGVVYWSAIVFMRWNSHFDNFNFRLLGPATLLFLLALMSFIHYNLKSYRPYLYVFSMIFFLSFTYNIFQQLVPSLSTDSISYEENIEAIQEKYRFLPEESIIVFGNRHLDYLRTDVSNIRPYFTPYFSVQETMDDFLARIEENYATAVYIEVHQDLSRFYFHESIHDFMEQHKDQTFVQIK